MKYGTAPKSIGTCLSNSKCGRVLDYARSDSIDYFVNHVKDNIKIAKASNQLCALNVT